MRKRRTLWKVKREGKLIGSWYFTAPGGKRVNTGTDDANKALKFRERWLTKQSAPQKTDTQGAAEATIAALDATPDIDSPASEAPPPPSLPAVEPVASAPIQPDHYLPPPDAGNWADDAARAAAGSGAETNRATEPDVDPAFLLDLLEDAATLLVEGQIRLQAWALARGVKLKAAGVPDTNRGRAKGKEIWAKQFKLWMPDDIDLPGWLAAPIAVAASTLPVQMGEGCTPLPKEEKKPEGDSATISEAVDVAA
jgi:hypothetical protein